MFTLPENFFARSESVVSFVWYSVRFMFLSINCLRLCLFLGAEAVPGGTTVARLGKMYSSDCVPLIFPPDFFQGKRPGPKRKIPPECFSLSRMKSGILDKLTVLAESAKYDVSCASSA